MSVELTILVDSVVERDSPGLDHGLAIWVESAGKNILFDAAGSERILMENSRKLSADLSRLDAAVISHGHYDHTGGLAAIVNRRPGLPIYAHCGAFDQRWIDQPGLPMKEMSCPHSAQKLFESGAKLRYLRAPEMVENWLILSGPVGGPPIHQQNFVVRRGEELVEDLFQDEMFMLLRGQSGWAIVTGCCHRGLQNTLRSAKFLARGEPITTLVGGLHLAGASQTEMICAAELLEQGGVIDVYPCHCTGAEGIKYLKLQMPSRVHETHAGMKIVL